MPSAMRPPTTSNPFLAEWLASRTARLSMMEKRYAKQHDD